jgi:hypothetical protein
MTIRGGLGLPSGKVERDAAIERIVKATGRQPDDRNKLAEDIDVADGLFETIDTLRKHKPTAGDRRIDRIQKSMKKLETLINAEPRAKSAIGEALNFNEAEKALLSLKSTMPIQIGRGRYLEEKQAKGRRPSLIEWLAGAWLPLVYEKRFGCRATRRLGKDRKPEGAAIDLIEATLAELKLRRGRNSIGRALTRLRATRDQMREVGRI